MDIQFSYDEEFCALMEGLKKKYGEKLFVLDGIGKKQVDINAFSKKFYTNKTTAADISVDANSNITQSDIITYNVELPKPFFRLNAYFILWKKLRQLYGTDEACRIIEMQLVGDIYINDFHGLQQAYCFNYATYDIALLGLPMVNKIKCIPPKHLYSFKSQLEQFIVFASNSTLGAVGVADIFITMSYYIDKILKTNKDAGFEFANEESIWAYVKENIVSQIYTLNQPFRGGHQCVTEDTEVLTVDGFKKYNELEINEDIYTWNNGTLNIQPIQQINIYDYDGIMHEYKGRDTIQVVTPEHRVLHKKNNSSEYLLTNSVELINKKTPLNYPIAMLEDNRKDYTVSDSMLQLLTFILTEGTLDLDSTRGKRGRIRIFKSPKRWGNKQLVDILNKNNIIYTMSVRKSDFGGVVNSYNISTESSQKLLKLINRTKKELPKWFFKLSRRQAKIVINTWAKLDGNTDENQYNRQKLQCDNYIIADQVQHLCFLSGKGSNIQACIIGNNKKETIYIKPFNRISKCASIKNKIYYKGKVFCPTTEDGVVVFRKNGKIFISGNSAFTNVSIFDDNFLKELLPGYNFVNEEGETVQPNIETVKKTQEIFLDIMNEELSRTPVTFPVTTACFSIDGDNSIKDLAFTKMIAEKNKQFGFINMYCGKTSTLSSCCFSKDQKCLSYSSEGGVKNITFETLFTDPYYDSRYNLTIFHNGSWTKGKIVQVPTNNKKLYKVITANNKEIIVTDDHLNPTLRGDILTSELSTEDYLLYSNRKLDTFPEKDEYLTYEQGFLIGLYLGDGSVYKRKTSESYSVIFSLNKNDICAKPLLEKALQDWGINKSIHAYITKNNVLSYSIYSKELSNIIKHWVYGKYAPEKELNLNCLLQSVTFRQGIIDGWYQSDGGNSNRIYTTSKKLVEHGEILFTSLGMITIINKSDRTGDGKVVIRGKKFNRNYPLYCIRWYDMKNKRSMGNVYKVINNCEYFKIKSIEEIEYENEYVYCFEMKNKNEPYFTLPNGIITHNCRLRSDTDNEYFNVFGAGSSKIGSLGVVTSNLPRLAVKTKTKEKFLEDLKELVIDVARINNAKRHIIKKRIEVGALSLYTLGFMSLNKQYSTFGITGLNEAVELLGYDILSDAGQELVIDIMSTINNTNDKMQKQYEAPHNTEQTPAENSGLKLAKKDKYLKYNINFPFYSNQFLPLIQNADMLDRIALQGRFDKHFSGGSILHINVEERIEDTQKIVDLICTSAKAGVIYFALNYNLQLCENGHMSVGMNNACSICGKGIVDNFTRVVGFLTNVKNWSAKRREEDYPNRQFYKGI